MSDIVTVLRAIDHLSVEDCFLQSPMFGNAADEIERLQAEVERLNSELADAYTDLNSARQDNGSFTTEFKRLQAEVERLGKALNGEAT